MYVTIQDSRNIEEQHFQTAVVLTASDDKSSR